MANIMITKRCNLNCEYCFANEFVNDEEAKKSDISIDRFKEIMDFILGDGTVKEIGLIGGEPTCHHNFKELLKILKNGKWDLIFCDRLGKIIKDSKVILLESFCDKFLTSKISQASNCSGAFYKRRSSL